MRISILAAGILALAACQEPAESPNPAGSGAETGTETSNAIERLEAMEEGQRNAVFIRALRDADQPCQHVESSSRAGEHRGDPVWAARCSDGSEWTIVVNADGSAAVLKAAEARLVEPAAEESSR